MRLSTPRSLKKDGSKESSVEKKKAGLGFSHSTKGTRNFNINLLKAQQRILRTQKDLKFDQCKRGKDGNFGITGLASNTSKDNRTLESIDRKILSVSSNTTLYTKLQTLTTSLSTLLTAYVVELPHRLTSTLNLIHHELASVTKHLPVQVKEGGVSKESFTKLTKEKEKLLSQLKKKTLAYEEAVKETEHTKTRYESQIYTTQRIENYKIEWV